MVLKYLRLMAFWLGNSYSYYKTYPIQVMNSGKFLSRTHLFSVTLKNKFHLMKITNFRNSLAIVALSVILFSSCKKNETATPDDPNIVFVQLNKTVTTIIGSTQLDSIDLNRDGLSELKIEFKNLSNDSGLVSLAKNSQPCEIAITSTVPAPYVKLFTKDETQPSSDAAYNAGGAYASVRIAGYRLGILDNGDKYLAFRFKTGTKFNYGWMKVNINSGFTEFKLIEYAYSILPDTPIAVGAE